VKISDVFIGLYGFPAKERRREAWDILQRRAAASKLLWCVAEDFNDILLLVDKSGTSDKEPWMLNGFGEAINYCRLIELGFSEYPFTWNNSRLGTLNVEERLDRALATSKFVEIFPHMKI